MVSLDASPNGEGPDAMGGTESAEKSTDIPSSNEEAMEARLRAVERALVDGEPPSDGFAGSAAIEDGLDDLEGRVDGVDERIAELEAAMQAVRGYIGHLRTDESGSTPDSHSSTPGDDRGLGSPRIGDDEHWARGRSSQGGRVGDQPRSAPDQRGPDPEPHRVPRRDRRTDAFEDALADGVVPRASAERDRRSGGLGLVDRFREWL